jgi:hypothetical protein
MPKKKKKKGMLSDAMGVVGSSVGMSVGSQVLGGIGGTNATQGQQALGNLSRFMPVGAKVTGASYALKGLKKMKY